MVNFEWEKPPDPDHYKKKCIKKIVVVLIMTLIFIIAAVSIAAEISSRGDDGTPVNKKTDDR